MFTVKPDLTPHDQLRLLEAWDAWGIPRDQQRDWQIQLFGPDFHSHLSDYMSYETLPRKSGISGLLAFLLISTWTPALAQDCFIGEVRWFAGNFAPRGWAKMEGQLLAVSPNSTLFSILGPTYGGDGRTTFGIPDLRGRVLVGSGT